MDISATQLIVLWGLRGGPSSQLLTESNFFLPQPVKSVFRQFCVQTVVIRGVVGRERVAPFLFCFKMSSKLY